jgi:tetratricopeptide (TPR) repeat protein
MAEATVTVPHDPLGNHPLLWKYLKHLSIAWGSLLGFAWLLIQLCEWIFKKQPLKGSGLLGLLVVVLSGGFLAILSASFLLYRDSRNPPTSKQPLQPGDQQLTTALLEDVKLAYSRGDWEEVLKIGTVLSRPLWVTGKYRLRVELGKLVEAASAFENNHAQQAAALVDDLGWTLFALGDSSQAKTHIVHGISIAESQQNYYVVYKGYRHLSGICLSTGNITDAKTYHSKACEAAQRLEESPTKNEVLAGLYVNEALIEMENKDWGHAIENLDKASSMYAQLGDVDRRVKLYRFKGDALLAQGHVAEAKDIYRQGLALSKRESRKDGLLMNTIGLAKVAAQEGNQEEASRAYSEASLISRELGRESLALDLEHYAKKPPLTPPIIRF